PVPVSPPDDNDDDDHDDDQRERNCRGLCHFHLSCPYAPERDAVVKAGLQTGGRSCLSLTLKRAVRILHMFPITLTSGRSSTSPGALTVPSSSSAIRVSRPTKTS